MPAHTAHSPYDGGGVALFSINKWPCFRLSEFMRADPNGPLFDKQVALFSVDKNTEGTAGRKGRDYQAFKGQD